MLWLLLAHLAAFVLMWRSVPFWIKTDVSAWAVNPADDTFHGKFHRQRATIRVGFALLLVLLTSLPMWRDWHLYLLSCAALGSLYGGYWLRTFNPSLSFARGLPRFYVSPDPAAALFPDRFVYTRAKQASPAQASAESVQDLANSMNHTLLNMLLVAGLVGYVALMAWLLLSI